MRMEDNGIITPQAVNQIVSAPVEEIMALSENVVEATKVTSKANEELDHLSTCLADFASTHEDYQKKTTTVRNQMRYLASHM